MNPHILLVDDEPLILRGLSRAIMLAGKPWQITTVESGEAAIEILEGGGVDALVSDLRMPGVDGVAVLAAARNHCPGAVRIALSGHADTDIARATADVAHRFIAKPVPSEVLVAVVEETLELGSWLANEKAQLVAGAVGELPVSEAVTDSLSSLSGSPDAFERMAKVVEEDPALTARVLHVANSPFFGIQREVVDGREAVLLLGPDTISSLLLADAAFGNFGAEARQLAATVRERGLSAVELARKALRTGELKKLNGGVVCTALMLRDIGALVLAASDDPELSQQATSALDDRRIESLDATLGEMGALLLRLWNLPPMVVAAVAAHDHELPTGPVDELSLVAALSRLADERDRDGDVGARLAELALPADIHETVLAAVTHVMGLAS